MDDPSREASDRPSTADEALRSSILLARTQPLSWLLFLMATLLAAIAVSIVIRAARPEYKASALIAIDAKAPFIVYPELEGVNDSKQYVQTQVELMRSAVVLEVLLARPTIAKYPDVAESKDQIEHLRRGLSVERVGDSDLYSISYVSQSPDHSREVANAVVAEYIKIQSQSEYERSLKVIQLLEDERQRRRLVVDDLKRKVRDLAVQVTGRDPFSNRVTNYKLTREPYEAVFSELYKADATIAELEARLASLQEASSGSAGDGAQEDLVNPEANNDARVSDFEKGIEELKIKLDDYKSRVNELAASPDDSKLEGEVTAQQKSLGELTVELGQKLLDERERGSGTEQQAQMSDIQRQLDALNTRRDVLQKRYDSALKETEAGSQKTVELTFTEADLRREEKVLEMIESRKLALQTESRAPARVTVRQQAALPTMVSRSIYTPPLGVAVIVSLLALAAAYFLKLAFRERAYGN